jgi:hypothetical protein
MKSLHKIKVHLCYCQIPETRLKQIAYKRFVEHIPTEKLMEQMPTVKDKEYLAAIALLDVKPQNLASLVEVDDPTLLRHLLDCRDHVRDVLMDEGIPIKER